MIAGPHNPWKNEDKMYRSSFGDNEHLLLSPGSSPCGWREWLRAGVRLLMADIAAILDAIAALQERSRQRRALGALDDRMLHDIGLDRAAVWLETRKPVWRE
jgi:uncharacterized protein YjiS (DUF1127 family)